MRDKILKYVKQWYAEGDDDMLLIADRIDHLSQKLFQDYEPAIGPKPKFEQRLTSWIENVKRDKEKKTLFRLIPNLFYVGKNEFDVLYRIAFNTISVRWLVDLKKIPFNSNLNGILESEISKTWYCPITDSMRINQFYHLNGLSGADKRPEWRSLSFFGSKDKITEYIEKKNLKQIVLLEDFVGSGNQMKKPIEFAAETFPNVSFLIIPIVMCPHALDVVDQLKNKYANITVNPALVLGSDEFVRKDRNGNRAFFKEVYDIAKDNHKRMKSNGFNVPFLGFRHIGGLVVLHTNTPNNSLPIIWSESNWNPLFNRHIR